jgi:hypothetical protein
MEEFFDEMFNEGWKQFIRSIRRENARSNRRLYKILELIKGKSFIDSVNRLATGKGRLPQIRVTREPKGIKLKDGRWSAIPELWVDQQQTDEGATGYMYVQVKNNRWLKIHY